MDEKRPTGFTLVELLITLALIAVLAGIALPAMREWLDNARLQSAVQALVGELQRARNHALNFQQPVFFSTFSGEKHWCFGWREQTPCDCRQQTDALSCSSARHQPVQRFSSQSFPDIRLHTPRGNNAKLRFSPLRGGASAGSFELSNTYRRFRIIVSPLGRIRLCAADAKGATQC